MLILVSFFHIISFRGVQWNSPKGGSKQNNTWTPQPISDTTGAGYKPMNQSMNTSPFSSMTITSPQPQIYPQMLVSYLTQNFKYYME